MAVVGGKAKDLDEARAMLEKVIKDGSALEKFKVFVNNQGGDGTLVDHPENLPQAEYHFDVVSEEEGYVEVIDAENIGVAASILGAGRQTKEDEIDLAVGIVLEKKVGDYIQKGDVIAKIAANTEDVNSVAQKVIASYHLGSEQKQTKLIKRIITA